MCIRDSFWYRVSEGRQIDDLWGQFAADARASYGFYGKDVDWEEINAMPQWRRPFHILKQFFWALILKLSPARRVLLLVALVLLSISELPTHARSDTSSPINLGLGAAVLLLLLLSLELADKVTMKRDLEIAREIQSWLVPSHPPEMCIRDRINTGTSTGAICRICWRILTICGLAARKLKSSVT